LYFVQLRIAKVKQTTTNGIDSTCIAIATDAQVPGPRLAERPATPRTLDLERLHPDRPPYRDSVTGRGDSGSRGWPVDGGLPRLCRV
ncbi:MAG: hypothetical protein MZW92_29940, partial [Comamonadaceae bacterium]|nr:hypothetical protein [Comamonadaceae bacterium]